ncbi:MAG: LuxR C-terminal-related transcriptional regulator [Bacteroidales bacterium]|nr:LuxR C-terminal-related transcriptional regulator [Bacteroidales bacterium]
MLLTKLHIPPAGNNVVRRLSLHEKLNSGLSRKLILVSAPAGYGKTTLLSDWIIHAEIPAAWLSLDNGDNDPAVFFNYLISGIQSIHKEFGQSALRLLNSPNSPSVESITSLLINEILNIKRNFLLVLDDFHLIKNNEVLKLVSYLLEHIPGNIHIVILTRSDPALSVSRLRSQHQLVELRSSDLSFSTNDIFVLFNKKLKLGLSVDDVYALETRTEGWIAGLQLTALSMRGRENIPKFIQDLKGDNRYIMDYLMEEVLKVQTDDIKDFLLQTSILEQLSAPLCNSVLGRNDSQLILETLEKNNMFVIPLDAERTWYRYHHLFADLLKQRLLLQSDSNLERLHNKACAWYYENSLPELAINHALVTRNFEQAIMILSRNVERMWEIGQHSAILRYGNLLPDEVIKGNHEFALYYSWILITTGQAAESEKYLHYAQKAIDSVIRGDGSAKKDIPDNKFLFGKLATTLAYMKLFSAPPETIIKYSEIAINNLSGSNPLWIGWAWYFIGNAELVRGDVYKGLDAFNRSLEHSKKTDNIYLIATITSAIVSRRCALGQYRNAFALCADTLSLMSRRGFSGIAKVEWTFTGLFSMMSVIQCIWTNYDEALENAKTAYRLSENARDIRYKIMALLACSYALHAVDDKEGAFDKIGELEDVLNRYKIAPFLAATYIGWKIYLLIEKHEIDKAADFAKEVGLGHDLKITFETLYSYIYFARLLLRQNEYIRAEELMSEIYVIAKEANGIERLIDLKLVYVLMYLSRNEHEKALSEIIDALEMAADENLIMHFLFDLDQTSVLLNEVYRRYADGKTRISDSFMQKFRLAVDSKIRQSKRSRDLGLSTREIGILKFIAEDLSNQEIADKMFISINTIKTHLKNIYLKLGVDSRTKAVKKAKLLSLV